MKTAKKKLGKESLRHKLKHSSNVKMRTEQTYFEMGNDKSECVGMWPKHKRSKTTRLNVNTGKWELLPTVILHEIYLRLDKKDRINASSTCHTWRHSLYHPKFWKDVTFEIKEDKLDKARYLRNTVAHIVTNATVNIDCLLSSCVTEFLLLLQHFDINYKLNSLILEPSHCRIETPRNITDVCNDTNLPICKSNAPILSFMLKLCCRRSLQKLSLGLNEELLEHVPQYLQLLAMNRPEKVNVLGLASVKDDPCNYVISNCNPNMFTPFQNLRILSMDYDILCDPLLESLQGAKDLERLVIHVHGIWEGHPGTTEEAWKAFKDQHPDCLLRVSLIHAFDEVCHMETTFLKKNMPLSHFKVFFCENVNLNIIDMLSTSYSETLQSLMWVDSFSNETCAKSWILVKLDRPNYNIQPDPLVILAWLCKKLEEITFIGYKYRIEDLVAIARLRSGTLKKLDVAECDLLCSKKSDFMNSSKDIATSLGKRWAPLQESELHPVILNPVDEDSDEYIIPHLLADIR